MSCDTNSTVSPRSASCGDALQAALLERDVADGQDLVRQQDVGLHVDRDRERQPQVHAARILAQRVVDEVVQLGELDDLGMRSSASRREMPCIAAFIRMLSCAEKSGLKPAPSSSSDTTRPKPMTRPSVGRVTRAMIFSSVDLPAPFAPMTPRIVPGAHRERHVPQRPEIAPLHRRVRAAEARQRQPREPEVQRLPRLPRPPSSTERSNACRGLRRSGCPSTVA